MTLAWKPHRAAEEERLLAKDWHVPEFDPYNMVIFFKSLEPALALFCLFVTCVG